jgi:hypothetical protein
MISEHVCIRTMMHAHALIHGPMDVTSLPGFLLRSRRALPAILGPYDIPTSTPYNAKVPLRRMPLAASCRLPIGCIGRHRHPPQSGYRTRPYIVALTVFLRLSGVRRTLARQSNSMLKPTTPASRTSFGTNGVAAQQSVRRIRIDRLRTLNDKRACG